MIAPTSRSTPLRDIINFTDKFSEFQFSRTVEVVDNTPGGNSTDPTNDLLEKGRYPLIVFLAYCYLNMGFDSKLLMFFWSEFGEEIFNEHDLMFITKIALKNRQIDLLKEIYSNINTVRIIKSLPFDRRIKFLRHSIAPESKGYQGSGTNSDSSSKNNNFSLNFTYEVDKANFEAKTFLESPFLQYLAENQFKGQYSLYVMLLSY